MQVTGELAAAGQTTHMQMADEAARLLGQEKKARYRHILVDEAQDLHPSQWRLLRAAVASGPDDLFVAADPHQRVYDNRVSLASLRISVRGRSRRLSLNYRTTAEILAWAVPLLGTEPVTGLDGEVDSLLGYRSPMHGPRPQRRLASARAEEFNHLAERVRAWITAGIEPHAIGVTARSAALVREAREALESAGIATVALSGRGKPKAVRAGTMQTMKGLEFQAVAVVGVEEGVVPAPSAVTPATEDAAAHTQDLQRERCVLFVACTRARDHLYVSGTGQPSMFLPPGEGASQPARSQPGPLPARSPRAPSPTPLPARRLSPPVLSQPAVPPPALPPPVLPRPVLSPPVPPRPAVPRPVLSPPVLSPPVLPGPAVSRPAVPRPTVSRSALPRPARAWPAQAGPAPPRPTPASPSSTWASSSGCCAAAAASSPASTPRASWPGRPPRAAACAWRAWTSRPASG